MIYELREYTPVAGRAGDLHARFRNSALGLLAHNGIDVVHMWTDQERPDRLVYLVRFASATTQARAWEKFRGDKAWQLVKRESERQGPLLASSSSRNLVPVPHHLDWLRGRSPSSEEA